MTLKGKAMFRYLGIHSIQTLMHLGQPKLSPGSNCSCPDGVGMGGNSILKAACTLGSSSCLRSAFKTKCCGHFLCLLSCTKCAQKFTSTWQIKKCCLVSCGSERITVVQIMTSTQKTITFSANLCDTLWQQNSWRTESYCRLGTRSGWGNVLELYTKIKQKSVVLYGDCGFSRLLPTPSWK